MQDQKGWERVAQIYQISGIIRQNIRENVSGYMGKWFSNAHNACCNIFWNPCLFSRFPDVPLLHLLHREKMAKVVAKPLLLIKNEGKPEAENKIRSRLRGCRMMFVKPQCTWIGVNVFWSIFLLNAGKKCCRSHADACGESITCRCFRINYLR